VAHKKTRTVALTSTEMVSAPGMLRWCINGYRLRSQRDLMIRVMRAWPGLTRQEWHGVLSGTIPHRVEDDRVIIELGKEVPQCD